MTVPDSTHLQIVTLIDGSTIFGRIVTVKGTGYRLDPD
jgi:hypothetical protein